MFKTQVKEILEITQSSADVKAGLFNVTLKYPSGKVITMNQVDDKRIRELKLMNYLNDRLNDKDFEHVTQEFHYLRYGDKPERYEQ